MLLLCTLVVVTTLLDMRVITKSSMLPLRCVGSVTCCCMLLSANICLKYCTPTTLSSWKCRFKSPPMRISSCTSAKSLMNNSSLTRNAAGVDVCERYMTITRSGLAVCVVLRSRISNVLKCFGEVL